MVSSSMYPLFGALFLLYIPSVFSNNGPEVHEIVNLPGLNFTVNFKQYSGFLRASDTHYLHYWFVEAQKDRATNPLVVWLNGGPGCSSLGGLLEELGPLWVGNDGVTLKWNEFAWNREANLLALESPAGVGCSYSTDFNVTIGDEQVADENYQALKEFFRLFPAYKNVDLFITGESYAGIYVPMFADRVLRHMNEYKMNLKGIAVGNGMVSRRLDTNSLMRFSYWHGLIDENLWQTLLATCCGGCGDACEWHNTTNSYCKHYVDVNKLQVWLGGLNTYDLYRYCKNPGELSGWEKKSRFIADLLGLADHKSINPDTNEETINLDPNKLDHDTIEKLVDLASPCLNETALTNYMRRQDVRDALAVPSFVPEYSHCSTDVGTQYRKEVTDVSPHVRRLLNSGVRVLLYYGDTDMACNWIMGEMFAQELGYYKREAKRPWMYDNQIEGFVTRYAGGLDFLTVKGVGHMVPQWKPAQSFHMIDSFLKNKPY